MRKVGKVEKVSGNEMTIQMLGRIVQEKEAIEMWLLEARKKEKDLNRKAKVPIGGTGV